MTSVSARAPAARACAAAAALSVVITSIARSTSAASASPRLSAVATAPAPSGLVSTSASPSRPPALVSTARGSTTPVTASPYLGSGSSIECPPTIEAPAAATASAPPRRISRSTSGPSVSSGKATRLSARHGPAAHRVDVRERVGGGDAPERVRVVDDRREEVDGLHDRDVVAERDDAGVVGGVGGDEHARVRRARQAREDRPQVGRGELAAAAGAVREGGQGGEASGTYDARVPPRREFSDAEIEAAVQVLSDPARLEEAQRVVASAAPALQEILEQALEAAEWFGSAHRAQVMEATGQEDPMERLDAVQRLIAEETRVSMLVGVAVGYELAHVLNENRGDD